MSGLLSDVVNAYVNQQYPNDSFDDKRKAAEAFERKIADDIADNIRKELERDAEEERAKIQIKELGNKTRALLLEGVLLAISLDLFVNHLYALIDCGLYKSEDSVNMLALLAGFALSSVASFLTVRIIYLSGIRDAIAEYRLIKSRR